MEQHMIVESQVDVAFCAAHRDRRTGAVHGHSYLASAWFPYTGGDVQVLREYLIDEIRPLDHSELPEHLTWAEDIAAYLLGVLPNCSRVRISRPLEGLHAEARKDPVKERKRRRK
jgi:hypothetical protein